MHDYSLKAVKGRPPVMTADQKKILAGRMESQTLSKNSASNPQELVDTIRKEDMSFKGRNSLVNLQPMSKRAMTQLLSEVAPETWVY